MTEKIVDGFTWLALEIGAELVRPHRRPQFRVGPTRTLYDGQVFNRPVLTASTQLHPGGLGVRIVCSRCGYRTDQIIDAFELVTGRPTDEAPDSVSRWMDEHMRSCPGEVDVSFSAQVDQLVMADIAAVSKLFRKRTEAPPHLIIQYRDGRPQLVPMDYLQKGTSESQKEKITAAVHAVLRNEIRTSARTVEAVVFVTERMLLRKLPDGMIDPAAHAVDADQHLCVAAVNSKRGGFAIVPLESETGGSVDLRWGRLTEFFGILDGILAEDIKLS